MFSFIYAFFTLTSLLLVVFATPEQLGVKYDKLDATNFANEKRRYYFGSRLTFPNTKDVFKEVLNSDRGQLAAIAKDAYIAMSNTPDYLKFKRRTDAPYVMTALAVENKIYLGTSMKGGGFLYASHEFDNPVYQALFLCGADFRNTGAPGGSDMHKNDASCGEITTMYAYTKDTQNKGTGLNGAHVVTVRSSTAGNAPVGPADPSTIQVFEPCGWDQLPDHPDNRDNPNFKPGHFGCGQTTIKLGVNAYVINQFRDYKIGERRGSQNKDDPMLFDIGYPHMFC